MKLSDRQDSDLDQYSFKTPIARNTDAESFSQSNFKFIHTNMEQSLEQHFDFEKNENNDNYIREENESNKSDSHLFKNESNDSRTYNKSMSLPESSQSGNKESLSGPLNTSSTPRDDFGIGENTEFIESDYSASTFKASVNISVSRNHLKINIALRIIMGIVLLGNVAFMPWLRNFNGSKDTHEHHGNINPQWIYYNKGLHLYSSLVGSKNGALFADDFGGNIPKLLIVGVVTAILSLFIIITEILVVLNIFKIVMDYSLVGFKVSLFQRYDFVGIFITTLIWFLCQHGYSNVIGLSYGFYIMIGLVVWSVLLKFHFRYFQSRLYRRRIVNQLLKE